jgi:hypothetical protein
MAFEAVQLFTPRPTLRIVGLPIAGLAFTAIEAEVGLRFEE